MLGSTLTAYLQCVELLEVGLKEAESTAPPISIGGVIRASTDIAAAVTRRCDGQSPYRRSHLPREVTKVEQTKQPPSELAY